MCKSDVSIEFKTERKKKESERDVFEFYYGRFIEIFSSFKYDLILQENYGYNETWELF